MFLRIFLLFVLAIVLAMLVRSFRVRKHLKNHLKEEQAHLREYLQQILAEHGEEIRKKTAQKNTQDLLPCATCGVCLAISEGVKDKDGRFFCSTLHLESFHQH